MLSEWSLAYALSFLGAPYIWGGQSPDGVDCSGYVIMVLQADGRLPNKFDATAQGIYTYFKVNGAMETNYPSKGCLAFYGPSKSKITHMGICLNSMQLIESAGGNSTTTTPEKARKRGAHVRIRPINYRQDVVAFITTEINAHKVLPFSRKHKKDKITD